jgi:uncharacterized protein
MIIDLRDFVDLPSRVSREGDAKRLEIPVDGISFQSGVRVELDVLQADHAYYCTGVVRCDVLLECSRCLKKYPLTLRGDIDFSIREAGEVQHLDGTEAPDIQIVIPSGSSRVDISDPVRETIILEIPLKPLCDPDCRGLCPRCGVNLNEQECNCKVEATDTRWDGLRGLS